MSVGNTTKIVSWLFYLAVLLETLLLSGAVPNAFTVPKVVAALAGAALLCPIVFLSYRRAPRIFILQFVALSACTIVSLNPQVSFWGADWRRLGLITWAAILVAGMAVPIVIGSNKLRWTHFLRFMTATGTIAAVYGILQWLNLDPLLPPSLREKLIEEFGGAYRAIGTIGQPNYFANYLLYPLFCAIALLRFDSDRRWRRFSVVSLAALSTALVMTMSRGAIAGAMLGLLLLGFTNPNRRRFAAAVALAAVLLSASGFLLLQSSAYGKQLQSRIDYIWNDTTGGGRLVLWQDVVERLIPKFWLTGTGLGMFRPAFAEVRSDRYAAYSPDVHWETAHNIFLDRWTEQGLAGLIALIVLIGITAANTRHAFRSSRDPRERGAIAAIAAAFAAACFGNLFNGETIPTAYYFCLWVGFSYATKACFGAGVNRPQPLASSRFKVCAVAASALLSCAFIWHAKNNWLAEINLAKASRAAEAGDDALLLHAGTASVDAFPETGVYSLEVADLILRVATKHPMNDARRSQLAQIGIEFGLKATAGDKSFLAYYYMSELGNLINDPRTEGWLRTVIASDPYWFRPHRLLASWLAHRQRFTDAGAEARTALHLAQYDPASAALAKQIEDVQQAFAGKKRVESYGRLPLTFEKNQGQFDARADFVARSAGYSIFLSGSRTVLALRNPKKEQPDTIRMKLVGATENVAAAGLDQQPGRANYYVGDDPSKWRTDIPTFGKVVYRSVYPGIDLVYYGNQQQFEHDFVVAPGSAPRNIAWNFEGDIESLNSDSAGNLNIRTPSGTVQMKRPVTYQELPDGRREVPSRYVVENRIVRFAVEQYDETRPLVIDPVLTYSTYLAGSEWDDAHDVAVDASGNAYVVGMTSSPDFPDGAGPSVPASAFVLKLNAQGSAVLYSVYLGSSLASANGIAVDGSGNAFITGTTSPIGFPITPGAPQPIGHLGSTEGFIAKLNPAGALTYSTYWGGSGMEDSYRIAIDASGGAVIAGYTESSDFPIVNAMQPSINGTRDAFVTKINPDGSILYSTYLGGGGYDYANDVAIDASGSAYVTGLTDSSNFPVANALQAFNAGQEDVFLSRLDASGSAFIYSTYLGGTSNDQGIGIALDASGNAYITGRSYSANFLNAPVKPAPLYGNGFVTKIMSGGNAIGYVTRIGGGYEDLGIGIVVDASGNAYVAGSTWSDMPPFSPGPIQPYRGGLADAFFIKLSPAGSDFRFWTYLGGSADDIAFGIAADASGNAYVAGRTMSMDFPTAWPLNGNFGGGTSDAFIAKIGTAGDLYITANTNPTVPAGSTLTYTMIVRNSGPSGATGVVLHTVVPAGTTFVSINTAQGTCNSPVGSNISCDLGNLASSGSVVITLQLNVTALSGSSIVVQGWITADSDDLYPANNATQQTVTVTSGPLILISRNKMYLQTLIVGVSPDNQAFQIANGGGGALNWTVTANSSGGWLSAEPVSGSGNATITVSAAAESLAAGTYGGTLTIAANATNSPVVLPVTLRVGGSYTGPYMISTIAGVNVITEGGPALMQPLPVLYGAAVDFVGNFYFAALRQNKLYKISAAGVITTVAGNGHPGSGGDGGPATAAQLDKPSGVAVDSSGNVYIADLVNHRIRRVAANTGLITTVAGGGPGGLGDGGPATLATLYYPRSLAFDGKGNLYVADSSNQRIRRIAPNGTITTIAGTGQVGNPGTNEGDGGPAILADLYYPDEITADASGNVYLINSNVTVRVISAATGIINKFAGSTFSSCPSTGDGGPATAAQLCDPQRLHVDSSGNVYIGEHFKVRKVDTAGIISTVAGTDEQGSSGDGGPALSARFTTIRGLAVHQTGDIYVGDDGARRIRKVTVSDGKIQPIAGNGSPGSGGDGGNASSAQFNRLEGIARDLAGNMYLADFLNHRIRKISTNGIVTTIAGTGVRGFNGDNIPATSAHLNLPLRVSVDTLGNVYVAELLNFRVRKITPSGMITTVAGNGLPIYGGDGGPATSAGLGDPRALAVDSNGSLYIGGLNRVRKVTPDGIIHTIAGTGIAGDSGDGGPGTLAQIFFPTDLALDADGNLYIAGGSRIRKLSTAGIITTIASGEYVAVDAADTMLYSDFCTINLSGPHGSGRVAGTGQCGSSGDGGPALEAETNLRVKGLAADDNNQIFFTEEHVVRKLTPVPSGSFTLTTTQSLRFLPGQNSALPLSVVFQGSGGPLPNWTATKAVFSPAGGDWLTIDPSGGTGSSSINVSANPSGLAGGVYFGTVTISSPQAINGSVVVPVTLQVNNTTASLTSVMPSNVPAGSPDTMITLTGSNFVSGAVVQFGEIILNTTFLNSTQLTAVIPSANLVIAGSYPVAVYNPAPGGGSSSGIVFNVTGIDGARRRGQITSQ